MSAGSVPGWLKRNWPLPLLVAGVVLAIIAGRWGPTVTEAPVPGVSGTQDATQDALEREFERATKLQAERPKADPKTTDETLQEHEDALEHDPPPDEAAARLSALGNLYKQKKQDYAKAARYFEEVIQNYPDWPGIKGVYQQLMTCYSRLDDQTNLRILYRKMMDVFPEESNEYQYAKDALAKQ